MQDKCWEAPLADRGSLARTSIDDWHVLEIAGRAEVQDGRKARQASRAITRQHLRGVDDSSTIAADLMMVRQ